MLGYGAKKSWEFLHEIDFGRSPSFQVPMDLTKSRHMEEESRKTYSVLEPLILTLDRNMDDNVTLVQSQNAKKSHWLRYGLLIPEQTRCCHVQMFQAAIDARIRKSC